MQSRNEKAADPDGPTASLVEAEREDGSRHQLSGLIPKLVILGAGPASGPDAVALARLEIFRALSIAPTPEVRELQESATQEQRRSFHSCLRRKLHRRQDHDYLRQSASIFHATATFLEIGPSECLPPPFVPGLFSRKREEESEVRRQFHCRGRE